MAKPTVGRVVYWYVGNEKENGVDPKAALVAGINQSGSINLAGFHANASPIILMNVPFIEEGEKHPEHGPYAEWMPYQVAQAKKELLGSEYLGNVDTRGQKTQGS